MNVWRLAGVIVLIATAQAAAAPGGASPTAGERPTRSAPANDAPPRQQVRQILEGDLYQRWKLRQPGDRAESMDSLTAWLESWQQWLSSKLDRWGGGGPSGAPGAGVSGAMLTGLKVLGWLVVAAAVVFLCVVAIRALRDRERGEGSAKVLSRERVREALDAGEALAMEAPQWLEEADRLRQSNDLRAMYRALYLALLSGLHQAQKIDFRRTRTNWMYVRQYRGEAEDRDIFRRLTEAFDEVWYGHHLAAAEDMQQVQRDVAMLIGDDRGATS